MQKSQEVVNYPKRDHKDLFTWEDPKECSYTAYRHEGMFLELQ